MDPKLRRRVAIGATGLAVAAAATGGAYAATSGSGTSDRQAFLNDVAKRLHVSSSDLRSAIKGALYDRLDAAVKAGRLTQAQADAIKKRIQQSGGFPFLAGPRGGPGFFPHRGPGLFFGGGPVLGGLDAAANYLDLTEAQLRARLAAVKSLAQIAQDQNKSVDGLKAAIKDAAKTRLDQAVKDNLLTQAQENRILAELDSHIDDIVNNTKPPGPPVGPGGPPWGGPGGP